MTLDQVFELGIEQNVLFNVKIEEQANYPLSFKLVGRDILGTTYDFNIPIKNSPQDIDKDKTVEEIKLTLELEGLSHFDMMSFMYIDEGDYIKEFFSIEEMVNEMLED